MSTKNSYQAVGPSRSHQRRTSGAFWANSIAHGFLQCYPRTDGQVNALAGDVPAVDIETRQIGDGVRRDHRTSAVDDSCSATMSRAGFFVPGMEENRGHSSVSRG
jgi:hypothetical protein